MKAIRPHASFIPNMGGGLAHGVRPQDHREALPVPLVDDQGRRGTEPIWMAGRNGKRMRATFRERPVILITSIGPEEEYRWKDAVTTGPEMARLDQQRHRAGHAALVHQVQRRRPRHALGRAGRRQLRPARRPRAGARRAMTPTAEIAIIDPATTLRHHGAGDRARRPRPTTSASTRRWSRRSCPFEMLSDQVMTPRAARPFKVVILANSPASPTRSAQMLEDYVARGGSVVAAFETSTRDENGKPRDGFGLEQRLRRPPRRRRPAGRSRTPTSRSTASIRSTRGFDGAARIIGGTR